MLIIYTPEDGPRQEFTFRPGELMSPEAEALEGAPGRSWSTFEEYGELFMSGSLKARRAALWILLRRDDPKLRFTDLVIRVKELSVRYDEDELARIRENIEADTTLTDEERAEALAAAGADVEALQAPPAETLGNDGGVGETTDSESPAPDMALLANN